MPRTVGQMLAADLPVNDEACESDLISLVDIVVTGIEVPFRHFMVEDYNPDASGDGPDNAWAVLLPLEAAQPEGARDRFDPIYLTEDTVRAAVAAYADSRLDGGMSLEETRKLLDGSYTDAVIADSILQFALYKEVILD